MIRLLIRLIPTSQRGQLVKFCAVTCTSVCLRAAGALLLVPILVELFGSDPTRAVPWVGVLTAVTVTGLAIDMVLARIGYSIGFGLVDSTQQTMTDRLTHIPLRWFTADNTALARQCIATSSPELVGLLANLFSPFLSALLLPAAIAAGLLAVSWPVGVAAGVALPLLLGALGVSLRLVRSADAVDTKNHSALTERIVEFARTQQVLRASRRVTAARSQTGEAVTNVRGSSLRLLLFQIPGQLLFSVASQIALILMAGTITTLAVRGQIGAPETVALMIVTVRFLEPFTMLADLSGAVESSRGLISRLNTVMGAPVEQGSKDNQGTRGSAEGFDEPARIEFIGVNFSYRNSEVLKDISFALEAGTTTAIVGPSGSGKSTILALIAGLHRPTSGKILIDGVDVDNLAPATRFAQVSMIFQHPYLFDGTIEENIRTGSGVSDANAVARAMTLARVDEIVERLPNGAMTRVGEAGATLSGGERQRVSIARALAKPAGVLLIDEATSALDNENEAVISQAINDDPRQRTRVIVAHRREAIRHADQVLFVTDGLIVERGTIDELTTRAGRFAEFWEQQEASVGWQFSAPAQ